MKSYPEGHEVTMSYGSRPNDLLLLYSGLHYLHVFIFLCFLYQILYFDWFNVIHEWNFSESVHTLSHISLSRTFLFSYIMVIIFPLFIFYLCFLYFYFLFYLLIILFCSFSEQLILLLNFYFLYFRLDDYFSAIASQSFSLLFSSLLFSSLLFSSLLLYFTFLSFPLLNFPLLCFFLLCFPLSITILLIFYSSLFLFYDLSQRKFPKYLKRIERLLSAKATQ